MFPCTTKEITSLHITLNTLLEQINIPGGGTVIGIPKNKEDAPSHFNTYIDWLIPITKQALRHSLQQ